MYPKNLISKVLAIITSRGNDQHQKSTSLHDLFHADLVRLKSSIRKKNLRRKRTAALTQLITAATTICLILHLLPPSEPQTHKLRFDHASIPIVISELEQKFQIQIIIPATLAHCQFTGSFYGNSPQQALRLLSQSINITYTTTDNQRFTLQGPGCR